MRPRSSFNYVIALICSALFLGSAWLVTTSHAAEPVTKVSDHELRTLFPGRFYAIAHGLVKVKITALADGSLFAEQIGKSDTGVWHVRSGELCIKFSKWLKGRTRCSRVTEQGGWYRTKQVAFKKIDGEVVARR